ncbi:MAG: HDOD domain-containing protein [Proteobacteria bacterium]|nr:HDOD domain-containing protein [Pseudomonadota bacterium]MBU1715364.1 HDOD domain-containing protein [Pseudomonadota bacterium]
MKATDLIDKIKELPTLPTVAAQINAEMRKESLTAKSLGTIISQDAALTAKVLKLSNSAFYGLVRQVDSVDRAVTVLGLNTIKNLALSISIHKFFKKNSAGFIDMDGLWHHSLGCAVAAQTLAARIDPHLAAKAFICGILHDLGINVIADQLPDEMALIIGTIAESKQRQVEVEKEVIGFSHCRVGSVLADKWNFPEEYAKAINFHHNPGLAKTTELDEIRLIAAVHIGNKIAKIKNFGTSIDPQSDHIENKTWGVLNVSKEMIPVLLKSIDTDYHNLLAAWEF